MGNQSWEAQRSLKGNRAHQICRTYLGSYAAALASSSSPIEATKDQFAEDLVSRYTVFNDVNTSGVANPRAVWLHLDALLAIAEGRSKADKTYLEDLEGIYCTKSQDTLQI